MATTVHALQCALQSSSYDSWASQTQQLRDLPPSHMYWTLVAVNLTGFAYSIRQWREQVVQSIEFELLKL
jgi:hypothetical protein